MATPVATPARLVCPVCGKNDPGDPGSDWPGCPWCDPETDWPRMEGAGMSCRIDPGMTPAGPTGY